MGEDSETAGGGRGGRRGRETQTATAWGMQESGAGEQPGVVTASRSETGKAISASANNTVAVGRHGERYRVREREAGRQENPAGESSGVGGEKGGREAYGVAGKS